MKKFFALMIMLFITASAFAGEATFRACSKDQKLVEVMLLIADDAPEATAGHVQTAFTAAASALDAAVLQTYEGFLVFASGLTEADLVHITVKAQPKVLDGGCS